MPAKDLSSPADRNGDQKLFKFGGGANTIFALDHDASFGYWINAGGGNDTITGADFAAGTTAGDAIKVYSDDTLIGGKGSDTISGGLGDDVIYGGEDEQGTDAAKGNADSLSSLLSGDVFLFSFATTSETSFTGGDDRLYGSDGTAGVITTNTMYGEGRSVTFTDPGEVFTGGDDVLTGGVNATNYLFGDVQSVSGAGTFVGGDDRLIGGTNSTDQMTGDFSSTGGSPTLTGGLDTFVIGVSGGRDTIQDFHVVEYFDTDLNMNVGDTIELVGFNAMGITGFDDLSSRWSMSGSNVVLDLDATDGAGDTVTFLGVSDYTTLSDSFVFTAIIV